MGEPVFPLRGRVTVFSSGDERVTRTPKRSTISNDAGLLEVRHGGVEALAAGRLAGTEDLNGGYWKLVMDDGVYWMVNATGG